MDARPRRGVVVTPEESSYDTELDRRLESIETVTTELALGQLEPNSSMLVAVVRLIQEARRFARLRRESDQ